MIGSLATRSAGVSEMHDPMIASLPAQGSAAIDMGSLHAPTGAAPAFGHVLQGLLHRGTALLLIVLLSPALLAIAAWIWRTDRAAILFGHYRVGLNGRLFRVWKFRSMRVDAQRRLADLLASSPAARAEWERDFKLADDPRVTPVGRFLRRTSLDELPQLFNVLRGEMALVGPRPITVEELRRYGSSRWHYLSVLPGMTGLWQVSGRNDLTYDERVALDRHYVESRSHWLDLQILVRTAQVVVTGRGAR